MDNLDHLLERLDEQWAGGGPAELEALLGEVPTEEQELAAELCAADLEWRWRVSAARHRVDPVPGGLPAKPHARDYQSLLPQQWQHLDIQRNLLEAEWCARSLWGDAPDVDTFAAQMPMVADWNTHLSRELGALVPWEAVLSSKALKRPLNIRISQDFIIGRQGTGEPKAPAWLEKPGRLIVANSHYRVVSREQLRVRRTRVYEIELQNVSHVSPACWDNQHLAPGESTRQSLPFSITIGELEISIRVEDPILLES